MLRLQLALARHVADYDALYMRGHQMAYALAKFAHSRGVPVIQECNGTYEDLFISWPVTRLARPVFEHMMRKQYRQAALVICGTPQFTPDRGETGFSALKLYESMACGVPVIGSDYPGVGDVIRQYECGIAVPPGDPQALAMAVSSLASQPERAREMGSRGRRAVELECSWVARAEQRRVAIEAAVVRDGERRPKVAQ